MTRYLFCALLLLTALLSGCATQMDVSIDATPDPDYHFDRQATVLVTTSVGGSAQSTLNARYYLRDMVNAMKDQGFREVFTDTTLPKHHAPIKMTVTLDVDSRQVTYRYTATDYGQVPTSTTTQCKKNKKRRPVDLHQQAKHHLWPGGHFRANRLHHAHHLHRHCAG